MKIFCRKGCGACCVAPSLSSSVPGMPHGKPAGVRCVQLTADNRCLLFGRPERPQVCISYQATAEYCGSGPEQAARLLAELELMTGGSGKAAENKGPRSFFRAEPTGR